MALSRSLAAILNPDRWRAIEELFDDAVSRPREERAAWIAYSTEGDSELYSEVMSLVASHEAATKKFMSEGIRDALESFHRINSKDYMESALIGPYRLIRELGSGGMGVVFLADRCDDQYTAQVAIKLIRPGMDTEFIVARFRRERQTLARLQHPNIARLLDGGTTDTGLPYFVMEYVDGLSLKDYIERHAVGLRGRIELFRQICSAVDYAHRNFVIHRDIKPGNIVIGDQGQLKLLDFGICKLLQSDLSSQIETRVQLLTPDYASPEQVCGEAVTLSTDIYSLGVVLYELMTHTLPHRFDNLSAKEIRQVISETKIVRPSLAVPEATGAHLLRGDIDIIVMRALEREPELRYQSVAQLAEDLRRHLANEPILARPPTLLYLSRKFIRRHTTLVAATALVMLALSVGLGISIKETRTAHRRLQEVQSLAGKLIFDVHDAIKELPGSTLARALVIQTGMDALDRVSESVKGDVKAEIDLAKSYRRLGDVQGYVLSANLGNIPAAMKSYQKALALLDDALSIRSGSQIAHAEQLMVYERIGRLESASGHARDAVSTIHQGLLLGEDFLAKGDTGFRLSLANLYIESAEAKRSVRDPAGSLQDASRSLQLAEQIRSSDPGYTDVTQTLATTYAAMGMAESSLGHMQEAEAHYRQGASEMEKIVASNPASVTGKRELMLAYGHIADLAGNPAMNNLGDRAGALAGYRRASQIGKELYEADRADQRAAADYAIVLSRLESLMDQEDPAARMSVQQESLRVLDAASGINPQNATLHVYQALELQHLGNSWMTRKNTAAAQDSYRSSIALAERTMHLGDMSAIGIFIASNGRLAESEVALGHRAEAVRSALQALQALPSSQLTPPQRLLLPRAYAVVGRTYVRLAESNMRLPEDRAQARSWLQKTLEAWRAVQGQSTFGEAHRREMQSIEDQLAKL